MIMSAFFISTAVKPIVSTASSVELEMKGSKMLKRYSGLSTCGSALLMVDWTKKNIYC
jgi:hypothetical protein